MIFIAELGLNHDGNFDLIYEMIRQAKISGANIAKFQFGWRDKPGEINCIDENKAKQIKKWCEHFEIEMMVSPITPDGYELAKVLNLKKCKIASRTVIDYPNLCREIIDSHDKVFCSLGFWNKQEFPFVSKTKNLNYLFCISKYPAYPEDLKDFPKKFSKENYIGYSDHTHGISVPLLAISRGAKVIEKHFTLNKTSQVIRDHVLSASPEEFKDLVNIGTELSKLSDI